jgi:hypothetical protein
MTEVQLDPDPRTPGRLVALLDFLEGFYRLARPPVRDIQEYGIYQLRQRALPNVPGILLSPGADTWLSLSLVEHEAPPAPPSEFAPWVTPEGLSPLECPSVPLDDESNDDVLETAVAVDSWVRQYWEPWSTKWKINEESRAFYKMLFGLRAQLERDRDSIELVWGFGRLRIAGDPSRMLKNAW